MQHDTTTYNMIQKHTTKWSNGTNYFFTINVVRCMKSWDRLTGALLMKMKLKLLGPLQSLRNVKSSLTRRQRLTIITDAARTLEQK